MFNVVPKSEHKGAALEHFLTARAGSINVV